MMQNCSFLLNIWVHIFCHMFVICFARMWSGGLSENLFYIQLIPNIYCTSSTSLLKIYTTALIPELLLPQFNWSPNKFQKWKKYPNILLWKNHILQKWGQRGKFFQLRETHSAMHRYCSHAWWQSFTNAFLGNLTRVRGTPLWNAVVTEVEGGLILHLK